MMVAFLARHVIAPAILPDDDATRWAVSPTLAFLPFFEFSFFFSVAATMGISGLLPAFDADVNATLAFNYGAFVRLSDILLTVGGGAPPQVWIKVHSLIFEEAHVLFVHFLVAILLDIIVFEVLLTAGGHAWDFGDLSIFDIVLQVLLHAELAVQVTATQSHKLILWELIIANVTIDHLLGSCVSFFLFNFWLWWL